MARQFVFVYRGKLDVSKFNTEERCRAAASLLVRAFEANPISQHVVQDDTKVHVNVPTGLLELGCTLCDVGATEEGQLVEYLKRAVAEMNAFDDGTFSRLGC